MLGRNTTPPAGVTAASLGVPAASNLRTLVNNARSCLVSCEPIRSTFKSLGANPDLLVMITSIASATAVIMGSVPSRVPLASKLLASTPWSSLKCSSVQLDHLPASRTRALKTVPAGRAPNQVKPTTENGLVTVGATTCTVLVAAELDLVTNFGVIACTVTCGV